MIDLLRDKPDGAFLYQAADGARGQVAQSMSDAEIAEAQRMSRELWNRIEADSGE